MESSHVVGLIIAVSSLSGVGLTVLLLRHLRPLEPEFDVDSNAGLTFAEGERDRMQAVAKGLAASSSGFLAAVLAALIEGKISDELSPITLILVLLGAVGMLLLAATESQASARYMATAVSRFASASAGSQRPADTGDSLRW